MAQQRLKHKVGDAFTVAGFRPDPYGPAIGNLGFDLSQTVITSQVRVDNKVFHLEAFALDQDLYRGQYQIVGETALWPAEEQLEWDVQFCDDGITRSTETVLIITVPDVTKN